MDLQFPNGQLTYVSGEGISTSTFLPFCGGLLQAQGQYPGEMKFSFSCKNKWGTRITPTVQWPNKSFTMGLAQALAWKRSGIMVRLTIQFSVCPTFGGSNPGLQAELIHSVNEELSLICGCAFMSHPSAFASLFWDALENKSALILYGGGAIFAIWLSSVIVDSINSVPLLPKIMELVGLGYTGWFVYRYLLFKSSKKELADEIEALKKKIAGSG